MSWRQPFPDSTLTGHFGKIRTFKGAPSNPHRGTDWAPGAKKAIPNITAGKVALIQWSNILGWVLVIQADDKPWFVGYCHLSCSVHGINCKGPAQKCSTPFRSTKVGDTKDLGETIGRVGNTGSASSGSHLHATLSKTLKGVFSGTVMDLHAHIKANKAKPAAAKKPKAQHECVCATCGKAIK
jgi:murein DD-endopeptidase MepM/ murein hydrolase activator NlpD